MNRGSALALSLLAQFYVLCQGLLLNQRSIEADTSYAGIQEKELCVFDLWGNDKEMLVTGACDMFYVHLHGGVSTCER